MKNKLFVHESIQDVRMIFGSGVSTFLDHARKFLYLIPTSQITAIRIGYRQIALLRFRTQSDHWNEFKMARLQKDSMVMTHVDFGMLRCYRMKILLALSFHNEARFLAVLEDANQEHLPEYWEAYRKRYHDISNADVILNTYLAIDRF